MTETQEKAVRILYGSALIVGLLSGISWVAGFKLAMRQYQVLGLYLLAVAAVPALAATIFLIVDWSRKNVKFQ